ncbi:hypothetical protein BJP34_13145 [Moorena producens PAL-8-15-08-1]|uniref:Porin n=1 Tax=Moorena producens PAL-8-15-08-1 TaxID=1458985 RepID=A0A1D8TRS0_9CYAN|nr:hypothetical protein [Moorena producens]AOX00274.1 hypothetical protein BJP34_13145 [Moorena producens PAL-8-15-08-1]
MLNLRLITSLSLATVVIGSQIPAQALTFNGINALDFDRLNLELETRKTKMLGDGPLESQQWGGSGRSGGGGSSGGGSGSNDQNGGNS